MKTRIFIIVCLFLSFSMLGQAQGLVRPKCDFCGKLVADCANKGQHPCDKCGKRFSNKAQMATHIGKEHTFRPDGYDVTFKCNVPSATMFIDGRNNGSPNGRIYLKQGKHQIKVTAEGYDDYTTTIAVGKTKASFAFNLTKMSPEALFLRGKEYSRNNEYDKAIMMYRKAADYGHVSAKDSLLSCYYNGKCNSEDLEDVLKWIRVSAASGDAKAQNALGNCYHYSIGISQDKNESLRWYRKAAEQGFADAQCNLAWLYRNGDGVPKDLNESVEWYRKAAEQGSALGQIGLAECYQYGMGVPKDEQKAFSWYQKSAEQGNYVGQWFLGLCYEKGCGVAVDIQESIVWYKKSAKQGYKSAQRKLNSLGISEW